MDDPILSIGFKWIDGHELIYSWADDSHLLRYFETLTFGVFQLLQKKFHWSVYTIFTSRSDNNDLICSWVNDPYKLNKVFCVLARRHFISPSDHILWLGVNPIVPLSHRDFTYELHLWPRVLSKCQPKRVLNHLSRSMVVFYFHNGQFLFTS
jgi:hypothetical protein